MSVLEIKQVLLKFYGGFLALMLQPVDSSLDDFMMLSVVLLS